jgi:hypothetical protein
LLNQVAKAPDGNGGVYAGICLNLQLYKYITQKFKYVFMPWKHNYFLLIVAALRSHKLLEDMAMRGVKYVDCYGVDNALVITNILSNFYSCICVFSLSFFSLSNYDLPRAGACCGSHIFGILY